MASSMSQASEIIDCPLCNEPGGQLVFQTDEFRVVWTDEPLYPGFLRLIWNAHMPEFSLLRDQERALCMDAVVRLEQFVLEEMGADKVNLASLGNVVPHLHWHVIPRFYDDAHFPAPVWGLAPEGATLCARQKVLLDRRESLIAALQLKMAGLAAVC